jgi:hypothetical protein
MQATKLHIKTGAAVPLIAALPYAVAASGRELGPSSFSYDPATQLAVFAGGRGSTCREDESVPRIFRTQSDVQKDD